MADLAYRWDGPAGAPVLVLANSLGTTMEMWGPQLPALQARFRVLRYDQRGHGATAAPTPPAGPYTIASLGTDVLALLDRLDVRRASVCGLSLGGAVAMWLAANAPERIDRLVLGCTAPQLLPAAAWVQRAATVRAEGTGVLLGALLRRGFTPGFSERDPEAVQSVIDMLGTVDPEAYAACCDALAVMDLRGQLGAIRAPTLILAGSSDPVVPPAVAVAMQERIAGATLLVLPAAHLANIEAAERFTGAVVDHLAGTAAERGRRTRAEILGPAHLARSEAARTAFTAPFQDLITRYAFGEIWTRPGLDRATRSCITLAMLVALGRFDELGLHVRAARRNGLSVEEIGEVLLQSAIYCGVPAANRAFAVASQILAEDDLGDADPGDADPRL